MISVICPHHMRGFHLTFNNGWTLSVQVGQYAYHDKRDVPPANIQTSPNAEIAAWHRDSSLVSFGEDTVKGWVGADEIAKVIAYLSALPDDPNAFNHEDLT